MILIGILGLCIVIFLYVLLYLFFIRRTNKFIDAWEKEIKEKIEKVTSEGLQSLEEAAQAIKASRIEMERFALEKGFISAPVSEASSTPETIVGKKEKLVNLVKELKSSLALVRGIKTEAEPIEIPTSFPYFVPYERKPKEWGNWVLSAEPAFSNS